MNSIEILAERADADLLHEIRDLRMQIIRDLNAAENAVTDGLNIASSAGGKAFVVSTLLDAAAELSQRIAMRSAYYAAARA